MKQHRFPRVVCALAAIAMLTCALTACGDGSNVNITSTPTSAPTSAPVPLGQMTLEDLMLVMSPTMTWSDIMMYDHTDTDATHAVFEVSDGNGNLCTLNVVYDEAANSISSADITYGDLTLSVLTDSTAVIRDIMVAIRKATEQ